MWHSHTVFLKKSNKHKMEESQIHAKGTKPKEEHITYDIIYMQF